MPEADPAQNQTAAVPAPKPARDIQDPKAMRALAHPVRLAILDVMRTEGELTATRAAELLDESPGNMSWHLQTLAKYGFVEEVPGAKGRSRPWKVTPGSNRIIPSEDQPGSMAAAESLVNTVLDRSFEQLQQWWVQRADFSPEWFQSVFVTEGTSYMTAAELKLLGEQLGELLRQFEERTDPAKRPADALAVHMTSWAHPLPRA